MNVPNILAAGKAMALTGAQFATAHPLSGMLAAATLFPLATAYTRHAAANHATRVLEKTTEKSSKVEQAKTALVAINIALTNKYSDVTTLAQKLADVKCGANNDQNAWEVLKGLQKDIPVLKGVLNQHLSAIKAVIVELEKQKLGTVKTELAKLFDAEIQKFEKLEKSSDQSIAIGGLNLLRKGLMEAKTLEEIKKQGAAIVKALDSGEVENQGGISGALKALNASNKVADVTDLNQALAVDTTNGTNAISLAAKANTVDSNTAADWIKDLLNEVTETVKTTEGKLDKYAKAQQARQNPSYKGPIIQALCLGALSYMVFNLNQIPALANLASKAPAQIRPFIG